MLWEKEKMLVTSNLSFFHHVVYPFPTVFSKDLYCRHTETTASEGKVKYGLKDEKLNPLPQNTAFSSTKDK